MPVLGTHYAYQDVTSLPAGLSLSGQSCPACGLSEPSQSPWQLTGPGWAARWFVRWVAFPCTLQTAQLPCPNLPALRGPHNHCPGSPCATGTSTHPWTSWLRCYPAWCSILGESASPPQLMAEGAGQGDGQEARVWGGGSCPCKLAPCMSSCAPCWRWRQAPGNPCWSPLSPHVHLSAFQVQVCDRDRCWGRSLRAGQVCGEPGAGLGWP